ncbi:MAG: hypothetical protein ACM3PE_01935, partial [Deltaproteobacteria bacterium]
QAPGAAGSKQVTLTITVKNAAGGNLTGLAATDFTVKINGAGAVDFTNAAFSNFADNGDGTYTVKYTGAADNTGYSFTTLTAKGVTIEAGPTAVTTPAADTTHPVITAVDLHDVSGWGFCDEVGDSIRITFSESMIDTDVLLDAIDLENLLTFGGGITDGNNFDSVTLNIHFTSNTTLEITISDINGSCTTNAITSGGGETVSFGSLTSCGDLKDLAGNDVNDVQGGLLAIGTYVP